MSAATETHAALLRLRERALTDDKRAEYREASNRALHALDFGLETRRPGQRANDTVRNLVRDSVLTLIEQDITPDPLRIDDWIADFDEAAIEEHAGRIRARRAAELRIAAEDAETGEDLEDRLPAVEWDEAWLEDPEEDWIVDPLIAGGRLAVLYSPPKAGKSLLMLEISAAIATGERVLGVDPGRGRHVLYVDFENTVAGDIVPRLQAMGYGPGEFDRLHYLSFPSLPPLDTEAGGAQLLAIAQHHGAEVVIIDTASRTISGDENDNATWLAWYRHTGMLLKAAGIAVIRLDHSGKDPKQGQRGASAKSGDADAIWALTNVTDHTVQLTLEAARMPIGERRLVLERDTDPLRHLVQAEAGIAAWNAKIAQIVEALDAAGLPNGAGRDRCRTTLKDAGVAARNEALEQAIKERKSRPTPVPDGGEE